MTKLRAVIIFSIKLYMHVYIYYEIPQTAEKRFPINRLGEFIKLKSDEKNSTVRFKKT